MTYILIPKRNKIYHVPFWRERILNVIVFEKVNTDTILRTFALDHQTKILTLVHEGEEGTADIYFKKISSSTDESVFQ